MAEQNGSVAIRGFNIFDPSSWLPTFGNWGGPGWSAGHRGPLESGDESVEPVTISGADGVRRISPVDAATKVHDLAYGAATGQANEATLKLQADLALEQTIAGLDWSNLNGQEIAYASMMAVTFGLKIATVDAVDVTIQGIKDLSQTLVQQILSEGGNPAGQTYTDPNGNQISATTNSNGNLRITAITQDGQTATATTDSNGNNIFDLQGLQSEGTLSIASNGDAFLTISGQGFTANVNNTRVTIQPGAQATLTGTGGYLLALPNSTVQTTTFDSTLVTAPGGSTNLIALGSNNNLVLGLGTTVDMLGNNNKLLVADLQGLTINDQGVGNQIVSPQGLPPDVFVHITSDEGFDATVDTRNIVFISNGGLNGGSFDGTPFGPGPDPDIDDGGDPDPDPDPLINGHAFLIGGDLQIIAGNGDNSIQGGLEKNVIMVGGGNNLIDAPGTENTVVVGGGNNIIGVGGVSSTVAVGEGQNLVTDLSQNGVIVGGAGHLVAQFGIGNHTILGGTGAALTMWDSRLGAVDPGIGIAFANIIRGVIQGDAAYFANLPLPVSNRLIGGPNSNYIQGGLGDHTIEGGEGIDRLIGGTSHYVFGGHSTIHGFGGDDIISGGVGGDSTLYGDEGNDTIDGGFSRATIYGGTGDDRMRAASDYDSVLYGEAGEDELRVGITSGNVTLDGGVGNDRLIGTPSSFLQTFVFGRGYGQDTIEGVTSRAVVSLIPGVAPDELTLQTNTHGDLVMSIIGSTDQLTIDAYFVQGTYTIAFSDGTNWNKTDVVNRTPGLVVTDTIGEQTVQGSPLADTLSGPGGNDTLAGGGGGDTYLVELGNGVTTIDDVPDGDNVLVFGAGIAPESVTITRDAQEGSVVMTYGGQGDAVRLAHFDPFNPSNSLGIHTMQFADGITWDTAAILSRIPGVVLTDTIGGQTLQGSPLSDTLSGPGGNTTLAGGAGNDTYLFDRGYGQETIFDQDLSGLDLNTIRMAPGIVPNDVTVELSASGNLLLNVGGTADQVVLTNFIERSFQSYQVTFDDGTVWDRDTLIAQVGTFPLVADPVGSELTGSSLADTLIGLGGNDELDGREGADVMTGGGGHDSYVVDNLGDQVIEQSGQGRDQVTSYIDYTLPDHVEDLALNLFDFFGATPIAGTGNAEDNDIRGNFQNNVLQGGAGNDALWGGFSDVSTGPGNDDLSGGAGNDTYFYTSEFEGVDTIHDMSAAGEGNRLAFGGRIRPGDLTISETPGLLQINVGSSGGAVILSGYDPTGVNGTRVVEHVDFGGAVGFPKPGFEIALSEFMDTIQGTADADVLAGTSGVDVLRAGTGDDQLSGGAGNDILIGGAGNDTYLFGLGDGQDLIDDLASAGESNRVVFGAGLSSTSLRLEHDGQSSDGLLTIHVGTAGDGLQFLNFQPYDAASPRAVDLFEFSDGTIQTFDQLFAGGVEVRGTDSDDGELFGTFVNDTMLGLAGVDNLNGDVGDDILNGGAGNDLLFGGTGADTYLYDVGDGRDQIEDEAEQILDSTGNLVFANNHIVFGQSVTLTDIDLTLVGGSLFLGVGSAGDGLTIGSFVDAEPGIRTLAFADGLVLSLPDLAEALLFTAEARIMTGGDGNSTVLGGNGNDLLTGGNGPSVLIGWNGDDVLTGGVGPTTFYGGAGNDLLKGSVNESDTYVFNRGDGIDTIQDSEQLGSGNRIQFGASISQADLILAHDQTAKRLTIQVGPSGLDVIRLENFALTGVDGSVVVQTLAFADGSTIQLADLLATPGQVTGTGGHDLLPGTSGEETLTGGSGNDTLAGGAGHDTYVFNVGDGVDTIADQASPGAENQVQFGSGITPDDLSLGLGSLLIRVGANGDAIHLTTFNPNDVLGARTVELFRFADGSSLSYDQLIARGFDLAGTAGNDTVNGTNVNDRIMGLAGDDTLVGGQGADTLVGGLGNDTYSVDSIADVVTEQPDEGVDKVLSAVSYTLGAHVEHLTLAGGSAINGTGNELDNALIGNRGNNILDGNLGADSMTGGFGNDTYVIDNLSDVVIEHAAEGTDTVQSGLSYALGDHLENLRLTGATDLNGTGNTVDNVLVGNSGNNVLDGGGGNDRLHGAIGTDALLGGAGDDTYRFDVGDGIDTIQDVASVGEGNRILFGTGITQNDLALTQDPSARTLSIRVGSSGTDKLILTNFDSTGTNGSLVVETLAFADGSTVNLVDLLSAPVNHAPAVAAPLADQQATEDAAFSFVVPTGTFADIDPSDVLTYSAALAGGAALPSWLNFDATTRTFSGTPLNSDVGVLNIEVKAADLGGLSATDTFALAVQNVNDAPTVAAPLADQTVPEDASFSIVVPANIFADADAGDALTYSASLSDSAALPAWLTFDAATRTFTGTPDDAQVGSLDLRVTATDTGNLSVSDDFTLTVTNVNEAPTVAVPLADQQATEDALFNFVVPAGTFGDVDAGDVLTYSAALAGGAALPSWLSFDAATRTFSGTPLNSDVGNLTIDVTATDLAGLMVTDTFALAIQNVNDAPTVANPIVDQSASTGTTFTFTVPVNAFADIDPGDSLTYSATLADGSALPSWLGFNSMTRTFSGTPTSGDAGVVNLKVTATDTGNLSASDLFGLTVTVQDQILTGTAGNDVLTGGAGNDQLFGLAGNDQLQGGLGNDLLDGGTGTDTMQGSVGNDTYVVKNFFDVVTEAANEGTDTVQSSLLVYTLGANVENLTLTGTGPSAGTGNALANQLTGNSGANLLDGKAGADTMAGGAGDDLYLVDHVGDTVVELAGEGTLDSVTSSVSYTLSANVENLVLTGSTAINGTGNELDNVLTGNSAANVLTGGAGNDTYVIGSGDTVVEAANNGTDTVVSGLTHTLAANVENLTLVGFSAISGTGNALDNVLNGLLNLGGNTLTGGAGNDTYILGSGDSAVEAANGGTDTVQSLFTYTLGSNVENLTLTGIGAINGTGSGLNNTLVGNSANNTLSGVGGSDTLRGGLGNDTVNGGSGNDTFLFGRGDGQDLVQDNGGTADTLLYDAGINPLDLVISRQANDLRLTIHGSSDRITVQNWYVGTTNRTETIQAGNGQTLLSTQVDQLIQAMAGFTQQTGLTWDQAIDQRPQEVQTVLAASWQ